MVLVLDVDQLEAVGAGECRPLAGADIALQEYLHDGVFQHRTQSHNPAIFVFRCKYNLRLFLLPLLL